MWDTITGAFSAGVNSLIGFLGRVRDFALSVWNAITGAAKEAASAQNTASEAGAGGFARGGPIHGQGTATSDSIPSGRRPASSWCGLRPFGPSSSWKSLSSPPWGSAPICNVKAHLFKR
jgi:hypothetical protein